MTLVLEEFDQAALTAAQGRLASAVAALLQPSRVDLPGRQGDVPSLLDQLADAVMSSQGGGNGSAGPSRWLFGIDASELLAGIRSAVSARRSDVLAVRVRSWAGLAGFWRTEAPQRLLANASLAERWVVQAGEVLHPRRKMTAVGKCPNCEHASTYVLDDLGEWVRRAALEIDVSSGWARCIVRDCGAEWSPDHLQLLADVLEQQRAERAS